MFSMNINYFNRLNVNDLYKSGRAVLNGETKRVIF